MEGVNLSCIMVIFGGTGDLTHRKLLPAIYNLKYQNIIAENFTVVSVGRRDKTDDEYRNEILSSIKKFSRFKLVESVWNELASKIFYQKVDFADCEGYSALREFLCKLDQSYQTFGNRIFYLAVAPENYEMILNNLHFNGMAENKNAWQRVVVEKPFGKDSESAKLLNKTISGVFPEQNTFRIDHYLGKEMVQSILGIRFANSVFEPLWNNRYIDNIQISSSETIGIENRGEYYEKSGAVGDMVQNHMLQMFALVAMDAPTVMSTESIRDKKVKLLRSINQISFDTEGHNIVLGQYASGKIGEHEVAEYRQESRVSPDSDTETFVALKLQSNNSRWRDTPFYIRSGKRLASKSTEIIIQFKPSLNIGLINGSKDLQPNLLVIKIHPKEEIYMQFNTKKPGIHGKICPVKMNFCQKCKICEAETNSPEAYEKLLYDVMVGDSILFTRCDEVEESWKLVQKISVTKRDIKPDFPNYLPGSWGPEGAYELLAKDKRHWWNLQDEQS